MDRVESSDEFKQLNIDVSSTNCAPLSNTNAPPSLMINEDASSQGDSTNSFTSAAVQNYKNRTCSWWHLHNHLLLKISYFEGA